MSIIPDDNPPLSVRAVPPHREPWDIIGRLYRRPDFILPQNFQDVDVLRGLVSNGDLMPSITNVIGVRNSPHLLPWATKLVATEAIRIAGRFPQDLVSRPEQALKYLKNTAEREKIFWGTQGTHVHQVVELLAQGENVDHFNLTEYERQTVDAWKRWLDLFQPRFNFLELTGFGSTSSGLKFAGTADFHATINGVNILGDYKCVTDETPVLLADGSQIPAKDLTADMLVVAWDETQGMHTSRVTYVGDNGIQDIIIIRSANGQEIECTPNHPMLTTDENGGFSWKNAEDITAGDSLFLASGWAYSPFKFNTDWGFNKHLSPYLLGMLWSLASFSTTPWTESGKFDYPKVARTELFDELSSFGFLRSRDETLRVKTGLQRVAKKTKISIPELLEIINTESIPHVVLGSSLIYQEAFLSGVQEVFANKGISPEHFLVEFTSVTALRSLQQLYLNLGHETRLGMNPNTHRVLLRVPFQSSEALHAYGVEETKVTFAKRYDGRKHTIAIEVEGAHTHVTSGFITHNTNRSGLHSDIAFQLAANRNVTEISPDSVTMVAPPQVDMTVGLHLSPKGPVMKEIESGPEIFEDFESLRRIWDFHAFDGRLNHSKGVLLRTIKDPESL